MKRSSLLTLVFAAGWSALPGQANGQSLRENVDDAFRRSYNVLQQQTDREAMGAEPVAEQPAPSSTPPESEPTKRPQYYPPTPIPHGDALAGADTQSCSLTNGSQIRTTGGLRPSQGTTCSK